jgi:pimeloyl-ACP methyl ester carboxylesterase
LAGDLTAPAAAIVNETPRQYLRAFTAPSDNAVKPQLVFVEPYQRGKIPVVFVHGLYSDAITWVDTINELQAQPDLYQRFQFWAFRYPTGGDVLNSAAVFRERLDETRQLNDPQHTDAALDHMVLIGHSLGGLVSKMQIVTSYDTLWRQIATRSFDDLWALPDVRMRLSRSFFFEPLPFVTRVVFIGTPHQGSSFARRLAGRIGSKLVRFGEEEDEKYRELMDANRGLFRPAVTRARPTSVDLLEPSSPLLAGLRQTPVGCCVRLHSIIGTGGSVLEEPGDGVVTVRSARHPGVLSELYVPAKHEKLHRDPESIAELARILREHAVSESMADAHPRQAR